MHGISLKLLKKRKKHNQKKKGRMLPMIIRSNIEFSNSFKSCYLLTAVLMNKDFTDVVEDLLKVESKLKKKFVKQQQRAT